MSGGVEGFCEAGFGEVRDAFAANFSDGLEIGASAAVMHRGRLAADLWGGFRDAGRTLAWERDTIVPVASTTKFMTIIAFLLLVDRGQVDLDAPVARYWPEFAAGNKAGVTVRDAMTHQAGVPGFQTPIPAAVAWNWPEVTQRLAAEPHWFGGERRICYHMVTYGFLLGEIIRRVDGRRPARFFEEELALRAGLDFRIGLASPDELARTALPHIAGMAEFFAGDDSAQKLFRSIEMSPEPSWERLAHDNPGGNGFGNARAIARAGAIIADGGTLDGVRFLSPQTIALALREHAYGQCPYLGWIRFGLGFGLPSAEFPMPSPDCAGWGGIGGSMALVDPSTGTSFAYAPNNWVVPPRETDSSIPRDVRNERMFDAARQVIAGLKGQG